MTRLNIFVIAIIFLCVLSIKSTAQERIRPYLNVGYITSIGKCSDCIHADRGGSIRLGILTRKKLGFYGGYLWFKVFHPDYIPYDDKGSMLVGGIDFRLLKMGKFKCYIKLGIGVEKFTSVYVNRTETETSPKPDFGLLFNFNYFNTYAGWQPSEPGHFNLGIGFTL